jgi:hypothetical protein
MMTNVVRFPVERRLRPTLQHMRDIAPDVREVLNLAEQFGMERPLLDLREQTDTATAEYIALQVPTEGPGREAMLRDLEDPAIRLAVEACRAAHDALVDATTAEATLLAAQTGSGHFWLDGLKQVAETACERAVVLVLQAHARVEEAEGVARAVAFARRGETWLPRDHHLETDALIALGAAIA